MSNFIKIRPVGAEFHAGGRTDRQTDITKLIVAFRDFANAPNNVRAFFTGCGSTTCSQGPKIHGGNYPWLLSVSMPAFKVDRHSNF
jgi:hypothetical protein